MPKKNVVAQIADAIRAQDCEQIGFLFKANPDQVDYVTPFAAQSWLGFAAQIGNLNALKSLRELGLDIDLGDSRDGIRPICSAAASGHLKVVEYLLAEGAKLDTDRSVRNPLFSAIVGRSPEIVSLLLDAGIDCHVRYDSDTMTNMDAVAFALMQGERECANLIALCAANNDEEAAQTLLSEGMSTATQNAR